MARLVLLNGAPGSGKSTLARHYAADHPLALALDVDVVRSMLGGWLEQPAPSGRAARAMALAMARVHLQAGHDVVVAQFLGRLDFVEQLEQLAAQVPAPFVEVVLTTTAEEVAERFTRRTRESSRPEHSDAAALLERTGGVDELVLMHARLAQVVADRPRTRLVASTDGQVERTYRALLTAIAAPGTPGPSADPR